MRTMEDYNSRKLIGELGGSGFTWQDYCYAGREHAATSILSFYDFRRGNCVLIGFKVSNKITINCLTIKLYIGAITMITMSCLISFPSFDEAPCPSTPTVSLQTLVLCEVQ